MFGYGCYVAVGLRPEHAGLGLEHAVSCGGIKPGDHRVCAPCGLIRPVVTCPFCVGGRACMACLDCPDCPPPGA